MSTPSSKPSPAELRALAQPPSVLARRNAEHWAGRLYMRRLSIYVTRALLRTPLSANAITFLMALVGLAGAWFMRTPTWQSALIGALLIQAYLLLDCSDGEVARVRGTTGATGIFLDRLGHFVVEAAILTAAGFAASHRSACFPVAGGECLRRAAPQQLAWVVLGMGAALVHVCAKLQTDLVEMARAKTGLAPLPDDDDGGAPRAGALGALRRVAALLPFNRITQAVEASVLVAIAAAFNARAADIPRGTRVLVVVFAAAAAYEFVGHLIGILASNRLRA